MKAEKQEGKPSIGSVSNLSKKRRFPQRRKGAKGLSHALSCMLSLHLCAFAGDSL
jgi:hypothetical protein